MRACSTCSAPSRICLRGMALAAMGRIDEAIASYADDEVRAQGTAEGEFAALSRLICEERFEEAEPRILGLLASPTFLDPEAMFHSTLGLVRMGRHDPAMALLARGVERGFTGLPSLHHLSWFDPLRSRPDFRVVVARAEEQKRAAMDAFIIAGGERVVGVAAG